MKEYCIIVLPGGEVSPAASSGKWMQTELLNIVEKEIQTQQSKLVNAATQKSEVKTAHFNVLFCQKNPKSKLNTTEWSKFFSLTSSTGFSQLINEPTHMQTSSSI